MANKQDSAKNQVITANRKAFHDYSIETQLEAGLVLEGWEVKSLRAGRAQLKDSYVIIKHGEAWLIGSHISPLATASTHIHPDPLRTRKLLLNQRELAKLARATAQEGMTIIALDLHWYHNRAKAKIALVKGKKLYDKRESLKTRDWQREQQRLIKRNA